MYRLACLISSALLGSVGHAATVNPTTSATFEFDVSDVSADSRLTSWNWKAGDGVNPGTDNDISLAQGASLTFLVGSTFGGSEYGSYTYNNGGFSFPITTLAGPISNSVRGAITGSLIIPGSVSEFFATFIYVDDVYDVSAISLGGSGIGSNFFKSGVLSDNDPSPVPLPAGIPLLAASLGALLFFRGAS